MPCLCSGVSRGAVIRNPKDSGVPPRQEGMYATRLRKVV